MKKTSKALLLGLCAVLLVTASVLGTIAYLTSTDEVVNTFTVGNVAITMDETDVDDSTPEADRDKANSYKLLPGHTYTKDPTIHVAGGSEDCYLFVKVENEITAIEGATTIADQMTANNWTVVNAEQGIYVYGATDDPTVVDADVTSNVKVFENFTINGTVDNATLADYNEKTVTVTAYAIQADGFEGETAAEIWAAANFGA